MAQSDRLYRAAVRGCLTVGFVFLISWVALPDELERINQDQRHYESASRAANPSEPTPTSSDKSLDQQNFFAIHQDRCREAEKNGLVYDLCQQWATSVAARETLRVVEEQLTVTKIEIAFLIVTLLLSGVATYAAVRSVSISQDTARKQLRAYVIVTGVEIKQVQSEYIPNVFIGIKNFGSTPAYEGVIRFTGKAISEKNLKFNLDQAFEVRLPVIGPNQEITQVQLIGQPTWNLMKAFITKGEFGFYVYGIIDYKDTFQQPQTTRFRHKLSIDDEGLKDAHLDPCQDGNNAT
jgi:hypothetical protein